MTTDLTTFKSKAPSAAFAALNPQSESLADGIGQSYGVIHYTGKNWSLKIRGETYNFVRQDDGSPLAYLDVIILRQLPVKSKTYYVKGAYEAGERGQPTCSSLDGVLPDPNAKQQQAASCALCPRNEWKTEPNGRKGRECQDNKRLAVLIAPNLTKAATGSPLLEPVFLRIPPASLNALAKMGEDMAAQGWHYSSFVTRIGFVPNSEFPQMTFKPLQELTDAEAPTVLAMREDPQSLRITGESELNKPRAPGIATEPPKATPLPRNEMNTAVSRKKPEPPVIDAEATDLGFGAPTPAAKPNNVVRMVAPQEEEVGETEEANADLDARIANLLNTN